jgi:endo-1,4-beta-xylanase
MKIKKSLLLSIAIMMLFCGQGMTRTKKPIKTPVNKQSVETDIPSLKDVFKDDFLVGAAVEIDQLDNEADMRLFLKHFNSVTAENCMKLEGLYPKGDKLNFTKADKMVKFARDHNISLRFHTLIWHEQCPKWFFLDKGKPVSKEKLKERMKNHIMKVVGRYKGKVYAYDVVNEPIDGDQPDGLKRNPFYNILGEEYIELALRWAHEADPDAKLLINEIWEYQPHKRNALVKLVKRLKAKGVPIDGIGMQMHTRMTEPSLGDFEAALKAYSELGIVHITEFDMSVYNDYYKGSFATISPALLNEQAHKVKDMFDIIKKYKSVKSVTFWGMTDDHSWLNYQFSKRKDSPLPFDSNYKAKPFFWAMVDPSKLDPRINKVGVVGGSAVVDGKEEESWLFANSFPRLAKSGTLDANVRAMWDSKYLYLLVNAKGVNNSEKTEISLFVDEENSRSAAMDDSHYVIKHSIDKNWKNTRDVSAVRTGDGLLMETRIPFKNIDSTLMQPLGFDIMIKNGNNVIRWNDLSKRDAESPKFWGVMDLVNASKKHPIKYGKAVIDGEKDSGYASVKPIIADQFIQGIENEKNVFRGATAKVWILWDEKALYVYAEVNDPFLSDANSAAYMQDSIEIFVDENNGKTTSYQTDDSQIRINFKNLVSYGSTGEISGLKSATKIVNGGYVVEVMIPYRSSLAAKEDTVIGFDIQVNDDQGSKSRDSISKWNDPTNNSWISTSGYGSLILKK